MNYLCQEVDNYFDVAKETSSSRNSTSFPHDKKQIENILYLIEIVKFDGMLNYFHT